MSFVYIGPKPTKIDKAGPIRSKINRSRDAASIKTPFHRSYGHLLQRRMFSEDDKIEDCVFHFIIYYHLFMFCPIIASVYGVCNTSYVLLVKSFVLSRNCFLTLILYFIILKLGTYVSLLVNVMFTDIKCKEIKRGIQY